MKNGIVRNQYWLQRTFFFLVGLNFWTIVFMLSVIAISLKNVVALGQSRAFLDMIEYAPTISIMEMSVWVLGSFALICGCIYLSFHKQFNFSFVWLIIVEFIASFIIMYHLGLSNNSIMLLVIAHIFYLHKDLNNLPIVMSVAIVIYILSNYNILYGLATIPFDTYIGLYNVSMQLVLNAIDIILSLGNVVVFVLMLFYLIRREYNENQKILDLNDELLSVNMHLQEYASMQKEVGEVQERNRLAREIHDTLGHTLTGLSVGIDAAIMMMDMDKDATKAQLHVLSETARQGLKDVRRSVNKLRPDVLDRFSLKMALEKLIEDFKKVSTCEVNFVFNVQNLIFSKEEEEVIFRIVQEGMTNAIRHGKAEHIYIALAGDGDNLIVMIEDDGVGCLHIEDGFGLHHMRERLRVLNGKLRVYGIDGFVLIAEIPLRKDVKA